MPPPLAHLRVVDLTDLRGAFAGRLLADLGADVVKVEPPRGDPGRLVPPFAGGVAAPDRSLPFLYRNANKRGAVLDLHDAGGWHRFCELCERADVLIENLGPEGERRHGLTPAEVQERHPHLVHVALADFGLTGPRAGWRLEALPAFAASGALHASGFRDRPPCWLPGYAAHDCGAVFAVAGALAALLARARHGAGETVEVSVQEAALNGMNPWSIPPADYARLYPMLPVAPPRNADGAYHVLRTADGYVRVLPGSPRQWQAFVALLGNPDALEGEHWGVPLFRLMNGDVVRAVAKEALAGRARADVLAEGRRLGVPITPVNTPEEFVAEEQTRVRGYFQKTGFPHLGDAPFAPAPFNFSRTPAVLARPAPAPGAPGEGSFPPRAPGRPSGDGARRPALAGLCVIDLGCGVAIPETGTLLAELGAEVIKVESRANIDFLRRVTVEPDAVDRSWTFNDASRGQLSVALDLRAPRGRELALRLCAAADVVIENNRGDVVRKWGLDYEDVRRLRADVVYPSAGDDRWVAIAVVGDDAWERFAGVLGWPLDPALASLDGRLAARAALDRRVAEWTRARSAEEAAATLQAAGVSAMAVQNGDDHRADPHLAARGAIVTVEHPEIGPERHSGNPIRLSRTPLVPPAAAPRLGADTEDVLIRVLGLSRAEVARFAEDGVLT